MYPLTAPNLNSPFDLSYELVVKPNKATDWEKNTPIYLQGISCCSMVLNEFYVQHFCFYFANIEK